MKKNIHRVLLLFSAIVLFTTSFFSAYARGGVTIEDVYMVDDMSMGDWIAEHVLVIKGSGFGSTSARVNFSFEGRRVDLEVDNHLAWSDSTIITHIPRVDEPISLVKVYISADQQDRFPFEISASFTNDPYSVYQYYFSSIDLDKLWDAIIPKAEVLVAIIDDGIYQNHEDLKGSLWNNIGEIPGNRIDDDNNGYIDDILGFNFVDNNNDLDQKGSHGTAVAGIIGAQSNNNIGMMGASAHVQLMPLIACDSTGCSDWAVTRAIYYAVDNGAKIVNLSIATYKTNGYREVFDDAIKYAFDRNVVVVVSAGNGDVGGGIGFDLGRIPQSPVCNDGDENMILGVGASDKIGEDRMLWSNYGSCVDIYAPGSEITSLQVPSFQGGDLYATSWAGTSFSAPIVSGVIANIISAYPKISNTAIYKYIKNSSIDGIINAENFYNEVQNKYNSLDEVGSASKSAETFSDAPGSQFSGAISSLKNCGIISGYEDGTFRPFDLINRAEFMKIVIGAAEIAPSGRNCFFDVGDEWFAPYVCAGVANGIVGGYSDGSFKPDQQINVAEALKITLKAFGIQTRAANQNENWFAPFTEYAKQNNFYLNTFNNDSKQLTREDMAELVYRMMPAE